MNNSTKSETKSQGLGIGKTYLVAYNGILTLGWMVILYQLLTHYLFASTDILYDRVKCALIVFQNAAVLEVVHAATGLVKSDPIMTAFQVSSRVMVVTGVLMATQLPRDSIGLPLSLLAWSITEIVRYANYTFALLDCLPFVLKWLRYSMFVILYPIGITGELLLLYHAQKEVGAGFLYSLNMPNQFNFIFNYRHVLWFTMLLYIPLFPQLYLHMFSQRRKVLGPPKKKEQ